MRRDVLAENTSESSALNVWGQPVEDIERALAELDEGAADGNADTFGDASAETGGKTATTDSAPASPEEQFEKWKQEFLAELEKGDPNSPYYKGLQKAMAKKDRTIDQLNAQVQEYAQRFAAVEALMEQLGAGFDWLTQTTLEALPEDVQTAALAKASRKELELNQKRLKRMSELAAAAQTAAVGGDDNEAATDPLESPEIRAYKQRFLEGRRAAAKRAGVDPDHPGLDYGRDDDTIVDRVEKFETSLMKVLAEVEEEKLKSVRQNVTPIGTRSSGGGAPKTQNYDAARDALQRGARERIEMLRKLAGV
jgi:DNA repair exonuclease SbcCD ATPase subunit